MESAVKDVRQALEGDDPAVIASATETLSQAMQEIGQAVYGAAGAGEGAATDDGAETAADGEDEGEGETASTVEGEFREV